MPWRMLLDGLEIKIEKRIVIKILNNKKIFNIFAFMGVQMFFVKMVEIIQNLKCVVE